MSRAIIKGETIPAERFAKEFKRRAEMVAARAMKMTVEVPVEVKQVLEAPDHDLRVIQLGRMLQYAELDVWAQEQINKL